MKFSAIMMLGFSLAGYTPGTTATTGPNQSIASIESAVSDYIRESFRDSRRHTLEVSQLDPRLQLPLCKQPLKVSSLNGAIRPGRNSLSVQCTGKKKWHIYTSADVQVFEKVVVLTQPMRRGDTLTRKQLDFKTLNVARLRSGYLTDPERVINQQARRHFAAGKVISRADFSEPDIIKKGERVSIAAMSPYFSIRMAGIALMDGQQGQTIRVKNIRSKRIVQATVIRPGLVKVK